MSPSAIRKQVKASARRVQKKARGPILRPTPAQLREMERLLMGIDMPAGEWGRRAQ
jgi:hypothetical protein